MFGTPVLAWITEQDVPAVRILSGEGVGRTHFPAMADPARQARQPALVVEGNRRRGSGPVHPGLRRGGDFDTFRFGATRSGCRRLAGLAFGAGTSRSGGPASKRGVFGCFR